MRVGSMSEQGTKDAAGIEGMRDDSIEPNHTGRRAPLAPRAVGRHAWKNPHTLTVSLHRFSLS